jgi:hypothetical protein
VNSIRVQTWGRMWAALVSVTLAAASYGLLVTPEVYKRSPVYSPIIAIAPLPVWGALWGAACAAAVVAAVTAWPLPWMLTKVASAALGAAWLVCLSWGHWIDGYDVAWTGIGLWWWFVASHCMVLTSRRQFRPTGGGADHGGYA